MAIGRKERSLRFRTRFKARAVNVPRVVVFRSVKNIYGQVILGNDVLASASSLEKNTRAKNCTIEIAKFVGKNIAERAKKKGFKKVIFDRNGFLYHGKVKAFADGAREGGLEF